MTQESTVQQGSIREGSIQQNAFQNDAIQSGMLQGGANEDRTTGIAMSESRFLRTVRYLQGASAESQSDFAAIAVARLTAAYLTEAQLAREEAARGNANLRGWSMEVDHFARELPLVQDDIELGLPVHFTIGNEKSLAITVADRTVILSHPRLNQQGAFEQEILVDFCAQHRCEEFSSQVAEQGPIAVAAVHVKPEWSFTEQGPVCGHQGIRVHFNNKQNLANARQVCDQFLQEVMTLSSELTWQQRHAVAIEWDQLEVQPIPHRPEHMVRLNTAGDSVLVTMPLLYRSPALFQNVAAWMRRRLDGQDAHIELEAAEYGW